MAPSATALYEKLGAFYLGKPFDLATNTLGTEPVLYDSKDLVTHAVIVGMTGSGKTGLGLSLIEEAAIDGVPVARHRPEGRPRQPAPDVSRPGRRRLRAVGRSRRGEPRAGITARRSRRAGSGHLEEGPGRVGPGRRAHRAACAPPPTSPSTRRAAGPGVPVSILESFNAPSEAGARGQRADGGSGHDDGDQPADAARRRRRPGAEPRAHPAVDDPERRVVQGREPRPGGADPPHPAAAVHARRRARPRGVLPGEGSLRAGDARQRPARRAGLRAVAGRRAARHRQACSTRRRASRAWRSSRSRT